MVTAKSFNYKALVIKLGYLKYTIIEKSVKIWCLNLLMRGSLEIKMTTISCIQDCNIAYEIDAYDIEKRSLTGLSDMLNWSKLMMTKDNGVCLQCIPYKGTNSYHAVVY